VLDTGRSAHPLSPQQQAADEKSRSDQSRTFVSEKVRPQLKNIIRQQAEQRDSKGDDSQRDQHIADQPRMPACVEFIHLRMPPPRPYFYKQKLLP
jgi:hypothetical protein